VLLVSIEFFVDFSEGKRMFTVQDLRLSQWFYCGFRTFFDNDTVLLGKWFVM